MAASGHLEVYLPEGVVEVFELHKPIIAIGRSTGNDLVLDRNGISRYHATISKEDQQWVIKDLEAVNGVYVDSFRISASDPFILRGGEEIQIADVRLVYIPPQVADADTVPTRLEDTAQVMQTNDVLLHVDAPNMVIVPGSHGKASISLENLTGEEQLYTLEITGLPKEWYRLERNKILLEPNGQSIVLANIKPLRRSDTKPGEYPFTVTIRREESEDAPISVESSVQVGVYSGFGILMGSQYIEANQQFRLFTHNQGNAPLQLSLRGVDSEGLLAIAIYKPELVLAAGARESIYGTVKPHKGAIIGSARQYTYDVIARSQDASQFQAPVSGVYISKPLLPAWTATALIPVIAILLITALAFAVNLLAGEDDIQPQILAFDAETTTVEQGMPITVNWDVDAVRSASLSYARPNQPPSEPITIDNVESRTHTLPPFGTGNYTITLNVENTGGIVTREIAVAVVPSITLSAEPQTVISGVSQRVLLTWSVNGAAANEAGEPLISLDSPQSGAIAASGLQPQGELTYDVTPSEALDVRLTAIGGDGTENSFVLNLAIEAPRCFMSGSQSNVYSGPGIEYTQVATLDDRETVIAPLGRNNDSTWMRFEGGWVRVANFRCNDFTASQLSLVEDIPPTPTPTPSPSPLPPTATPTEIAPSNTPPPTPRRDGGDEGARG